MSHYFATISWARNGAPFTDNRYSRAHRWRFDGGVDLEASSSPHIVPFPLSKAEAVDPEEAFVASLSSCHMLWFLSIAARLGYVVDRYDDEAVGVLAPDGKGRLAMTEVTLRPRVAFGGERFPSDAAVAEMHHDAHEHCFIARSVKTNVTCTPVAAGVSEPGQ